jgi:cytochrome P450
MTHLDPLTLAGVADTPSLLAASRDPAWLVEPGVAHVVGLAACRSVLLDHETFSSNGAEHGPAGLAGAAAPGKTLNTADPPDHARLRGVVAPWFTRRSVNARVPHLTALANALLDPLVAAGRFEVVSDFASPFVLGVLSSILGLPAGMEPELQRLGDTITAPAGRGDVERARRELAELFDHVLATPERLAPGGLLLELAKANADGRMAPTELSAQCVVLVVAGSETTRNALAATVLTLSQRPDLFDGLVRNDAALATFVEEALRFHSSVQAAVRFTTHPTSIGDVDVPRGCPVFVWLSAANHDPSAYERPEVFDVDRTGGHVAFGVGVHTCLGVHLARAELIAGLGAIVRRCANLRFADESVEWLRSPLARGPVRVRVTFDPRSQS